MSCLNCKHFDNKCTYEYNCSEKVTLDKAYQQGRADREKEFAKRIEKLNTIENIMLQYNADWYADEDNGVPDCEVLESIWNVIQDNGLDIDIEQDYRKGRADAIDECIGAVNSEYIENINLVPYRLVKRLEQLKEKSE